MGAVSGLSDVPEDAAAKLLVRAFRQLAPGNQRLALEALRRTPERQKLLDASGLDEASN
jgi:hypothetical protein